MARSYLCVIEGHGDQWEASCLDLDIAVAGDSFESVKQDLELAVLMYVEAAQNESPADQARLLARKAPFLLRMRTTLHLLMSVVRAVLTSRTNRADGGGSFILPCPA
jgi:hypothetical protein